jgi:hypothetical protein
MSKGVTSGVFFAATASNSILRHTHIGPDLRRRNCGGQVAHAHQIVGDAGQGKDPVHFAHPAMPHLPHERDRLQPAKTFFDPFPLLLADGVTRVPRGAAILRIEYSICSNCARNSFSGAIDGRPTRAYIVSKRRES